MDWTWGRAKEWAMRYVSCGSLPLAAAYLAGLLVVDGQCYGMWSCAGYSTGDRSFPGMRRYFSMTQPLVFSYGALGVGTVSSIASCWSISHISMRGTCKCKPGPAAF